MGKSLSEWLSVKVELREGCVMSPWLFIIETEMKSGINDVGKVSKGMKTAFTCRGMGMNVKRFYGNSCANCTFWG